METVFRQAKSLVCGICVWIYENYSRFASILIYLCDTQFETGSTPAQMLTSGRRRASSFHALPTIFSVCMQIPDYLVKIRCQIIHRFSDDYRLWHYAKQIIISPRHSRFFCCSSNKLCVTHCYSFDVPRPACLPLLNIWEDLWTGCLAVIGCRQLSCRHGQLILGK